MPIISNPLTIVQAGENIEDYTGSYVITENGTVPCAGKKMISDLTVDVPRINALDYVSVSIGTGFAVKDGEFNEGYTYESDSGLNLYYIDIYGVGGDFSPLEDGEQVKILSSEEYVKFTDSKGQTLYFKPAELESDWIYTICSNATEIKAKSQYGHVTMMFSNDRVDICISKEPEMGIEYES